VRSERLSAIRAGDPEDDPDEEDPPPEDEDDKSDDEGEEVFPIDDPDRNASSS